MVLGRLGVFGHLGREPVGVAVCPVGDVVVEPLGVVVAVEHRREREVVCEVFAVALRRLTDGARVSHVERGYGREA
ncbi:hypothetical protein GCM10028858_11980 [Halorubrum pallidum]